MIRSRGATFALFPVLMVSWATSQNAGKRPSLPTGHLTPGHDMTSARGGHTATILPNFKVFIAGGKNERGSILASTEVYDPTTETFSPGTKMSIPREGHAAASLADGKILIAGGATRGGIPLSSCEVYDYETEKFTTRGSMHARRVRPTAIVLRDGRVLLIGGQNGSQPLDSAETYDLLTGKWKLVGKMSFARVGHTATLLADGRVLVVGGTGNQHSVLASAEIFDPKSNQFSRSGDLHQARSMQTDALLPDGNVLIAGGAGDTKATVPLASTELFDPATNSFSVSGSMTEPRMKLPDAALLLDGRILLVGGERSAEIYDPRTVTSRPVLGNLDTARYDSAAIQLMDGSSRIFGGYDASGVSTAKSWVYRP